VAQRLAALDRREHRHARARRRIVVEVAAHAGVDRSGELRLVVRIAQPALLVRVRDESRLDQHRGHVGRSQHDQARVLHLALLEPADLVELGEHARRRVAARADGGVLGEVQQHGLQHVALVVQRHAADEVGGVLAVREPAGGLAARAARGKHIYGGASDTSVHEGVRVDRDEEVGLVRARPADAVLELHEIVAGARQHGLHAGLGIDAVRELLRDRERDRLLARAALADRARVLAAVPGVDRDDEVALPVAARDFDRRRGCRHALRGAEPVAEIDDEAMPVGVVGRREESLRFDLLAHVEHDAQPRPAPLAEPHGFHESGPVRQFDRGSLAVHAFEVNHDALGAGQGKQRVSRGLGQVEDDARRFGAGPETDVLERGCGRFPRSRGQQQDDKA
jgi:hypothetical protein